MLSNYARRHCLNIVMSNYGGSCWKLESGGRSAMWTNKGNLIQESNNRDECSAMLMMQYIRNLICTLKGMLYTLLLPYQRRPQPLWCTISEIMIHKVLIRYAGLFWKLLEVFNCIRIQTYRYGFLKFPSIWVLYRMWKIIFFSHINTSCIGFLPKVVPAGQKWFESAHHLHGSNDRQAIAASFN